MSFASFNFGSSGSLPTADLDADAVKNSSPSFLGAILSSNTELKLQALKKLRKLSVHAVNRPLLVNTDSGLISALVEALISSDEECVQLILNVLLDLSNHPDTKRDILLLNPYIGRNLLAVLRGEDSVSHLIALGVLKNISEDEQNAIYLMSPSLGLLPHLFELLHFEPGEARTAALCVLWNVSDCVEIRRQGSLEVVDMVIVLVAVLRDPPSRRMAIRILLNLYRYNPGDGAFASPRLSFVSVLVEHLNPLDEDYFLPAMELIVLLSEAGENIDYLISDESLILDTFCDGLSNNSYSQEQLYLVGAALANLSASPLCAEYASRRQPLVWLLFAAAEGQSEADDLKLTESFLSTVLNLVTNMDPREIAECVFSSDIIFALLRRHVGSPLLSLLHVVEIVLAATTADDNVVPHSPLLCRSLCRALDIRNRNDGLFCAEAAANALLTLSGRLSYRTVLLESELNLLGLLSDILSSESGSLRSVALVTLANLSSDAASFQYGSHGPSDLLASLLGVMSDGDPEDAESKDVAMEIVHTLSQTVNHRGAIMQHKRDIVNVLVCALKDDRGVKSLALHMLLDMTRLAGVADQLLEKKIIGTLVVVIFEGIEIGNLMYQTLAVEILLVLVSRESFVAYEDTGLVVVLACLLGMDNPDIASTALSVVNTLLVLPHTNVMVSLVNTSEMRKALGSAIKRFIGKPLELCLSVISTLSENGEEHCKLLCADEGLCAAVVFLLGGQQTEAEQVALSILFNLSSFEANVPRLCDADYDLVSSLVAILSTRKDGVRLTALGILLNLSSIPDSIRFISSTPLDLVSALLTVLKEEQDSDEHWNRAFSILKELVASSACLSVLMVGDVGFVPYIVKNLATRSSRQLPCAEFLWILLEKPKGLLNLTDRSVIVQILLCARVVIRHRFSLADEDGAVAQRLMLLLLERVVAVEMFRNVIISDGDELFSVLVSLLDTTDSDTLLIVLQTLQALFKTIRTEEALSVFLADQLDNDMDTPEEGVIGRLTHIASLQLHHGDDCRAAALSVVLLIVSVKPDHVVNNYPRLCEVVVATMKSHDRACCDAAMQVTRHLTEKAYLVEKMLSPDIDIASSLSETISDRAGFFRDVALDILVSLSGHNRFPELVSDSAVKVISALLKVVRETVGPPRYSAITVLMILLNYREHARSAVSLGPYFVDSLVSAMSQDSSKTFHKHVLGCIDIFLDDRMLLSFVCNSSDRLLPALSKVGNDAANRADQSFLKILLNILLKIASCSKPSPEFFSPTGSVYCMLLPLLYSGEPDVVLCSLQTLDRVLFQCDREHVVKVVKKKFADTDNPASHSDIFVAISAIFPRVDPTRQLLCLSILETLTRMEVKEIYSFIVAEYRIICNVLISACRQCGGECKLRALNVLCNLSSCKSNIKSMVSKELDLLGLLSDILSSESGSLRSVALVTLANLSSDAASFQYGSNGPSDLLTSLLGVMSDGDPEDSDSKDVAMEIVHSLSQTASHMACIISTGVRLVDSLLLVLTTGKESTRILVLQMLRELSDTVGGKSLMVARGEPLLSALKGVIMRSVDENSASSSLLAFYIIRNISRVSSIRNLFTLPELGIFEVIVVMLGCGEYEVVEASLFILDNLVSSVDSVSNISDWFSTEVLCIMASLLSRLDGENLAVLIEIIIKLTAVESLHAAICDSESGVIDAAVLLLQEEMSPIAVCKEVLLILVNVTMPGRDLQWATNALRAATSGHPPPLLRALTGLRSQATPEGEYFVLLELKSQVISNLSESPACCRGFCGSQPSIKAMLGYWSYCADHCSFLSTLNAVNNFCSACKGFVFPAEPLSRLVIVLVNVLKNMDDVSVSFLVLQALGNIMTNKLNVESILQSDINFVSSLLRMHGVINKSTRLTILQIINKIVEMTRERSVFVAWMCDSDGVMTGLLTLLTGKDSEINERLECLSVIQQLTVNVEAVEVFVSKLDRVKTLLLCLNGVVNEDELSPLCLPSLDIYNNVLMATLQPERVMQLSYVNGVDFLKNIMGQTLKAVLLLLHGRNRDGPTPQMSTACMLVIRVLLSNEDCFQYILIHAEELHVVKLLLRHLRLCSSRCSDSGVVTVAPEEDEIMCTAALERFFSRKVENSQLSHALNEATTVFGIIFSSSRISPPTLVPILTITSSLISRLDSSGSLGPLKGLVQHLFTLHQHISDFKDCNGDSELDIDSLLRSVLRVLFELCSKGNAMCVRDLPPVVLQSFITNLLVHVNGGFEAEIYNKGSEDRYFLMLAVLSLYCSSPENCAWFLEDTECHIVDILCAVLSKGPTHPLFSGAVSMLGALCRDDLVAALLFKRSGRHVFQSLITGKALKVSREHNTLLHVVSQCAKSEEMLPLLLSEFSVIPFLVAMLRTDSLNTGFELILGVISQCATVCHSKPAHELLQNGAPALVALHTATLLTAFDTGAEAVFAEGFEEYSRRLGVLRVTLQVMASLLNNEEQPDNSSLLLTPELRVLEVVMSALRDYDEVVALCLNDILVKLVLVPVRHLRTFSRPDSGMLLMLADWLARIRHDSGDDDRNTILQLIDKISDCEENARFLVSLESEACLVVSLVDILKKSFDRDPETCVTSISILTKLTAHKQCKEALMTKKSGIINLLVLLSEKKRGPLISNGAKQILVNIGESDRIFEFPEYTDSTVTAGNHPLLSDEPSESAYLELLDMVTSIKPAFPTPNLLNSDPPKQWPTDSPASPAHAPVDYHVQLESSPACIEVCDLIGRFVVEHQSSGIVDTSDVQPTVSKLLVLSRDRVNAMYLCRQESKLSQFYCCFTVDDAVFTEKNMILSLLEVLMNLAVHQKNVSQLVGPEFNCLAFLMHVLTSCPDECKELALSILIQICSDNSEPTRPNQVISQNFAELVGLLACFARERDDTIRLLSIRTVAACSMKEDLARLVLKENLDVTLVGYLLKSRRNPRGWHEQSSIESQTLVCVMHLAQWPDSARQLSKLGLVHILLPISQNSGLNGLRATVTLAILAGSSANPVLKNAGAVYDSIAIQLRIALESHVDNLTTTKESPIVSDRKSNTTGPTTSSTGTVVNDDPDRSDPFDDMSTLDICLAALESLASCDVHKHGLATPKVMGVLVGVARTEIVYLSHGRNRPQFFDVDNADIDSNYGGYYRLHKTLEIILQLCAVYDNNDSLKKKLILDKLELGPRIMALLELQIPKVIRSLGECILLRLRPCTALLDYAAAEDIRNGKTPNNPRPHRPLLSHATSESPRVLDLISALDICLRSMGISTVRHHSGLTLISNVVFGKVNMDDFYSQAGTYVMVVCASREYCTSARCRMECDFARKFERKNKLKLIFAVVEQDYSLELNSHSRSGSWLRTLIAERSWLPMWEEHQVRKVAQRVSDSLSAIRKKQSKNDPYVALGFPRTKLIDPPAANLSDRSAEAQLDYMLSKSERNYSPKHNIRGMNPLSMSLGVFGNAKPPAQTDTFHRAWDILNSASNVHDQEGLDDLIENIGLCDAHDLRHCEKADLLQLTKTLKKVPQRKFLAMLFGKES